MNLLAILYQVKKSFRHNLFSKKILDINISKASSFASGVLLDIGCGKKPYQHHFENVKKYWAIDLHERVIHKRRRVKVHRKLREYIDDEVNNIMPDVIASALYLPIRDSSVDTVLMTEVLEHIPSPEKLIVELERVLNPKGIVIFTVPFCWVLHEMPHDYLRYTKWGLRELFKNTGLEIVTIKAYGDSLFTIGSLISEIIYIKFGLNYIANIPISIFCILTHLVFIISGKIFRNEELPFGHLLIAKITDRDVL